MLLSEKEAAKLLNCSVAALRRWRREERGPVWLKVERMVRYREIDLIDYLDRNAQFPEKLEVNLTPEQHERLKKFQIRKVENGEAYEK